MKTLCSSSFAVSGLLLVVTGCTVGEPNGLDTRDNELPLPEGTNVVGEFKVHLNPNDGRMEIWRLKRHDPGKTPLSQSDLTIVGDDAEGSGPANTIELVTNSVGVDGMCPVQQTNSFCGNVTLRHFFASQGFNNMYVQVTKIADVMYQDIAGHEAVNSDPPALGLSNALGLWLYTSDAYVANAPLSGIFDKSPTNNAGSKDWVFNRPDDVDTYIYLRAVASPNYTNYTRTKKQGAGATFIDACTLGGAVTGQPTVPVSVTLPFPFTLYGGGSTTGYYGLTSLKVNFNWKGAITLENTAVPGGLNASLPCSVGCPKPAMFPFWENMSYNGSTGKMCYGFTGAAPARKFVVTWSDMKFANDATNATHLTFSAYLYEGSDKFEFVYQTMTSSTVPARANGNAAVVGAQSSTGTVATPSSARGVTNTSTALGTLSYLFTPFF